MGVGFFVVVFFVEIVMEKSKQFNFSFTHKAEKKYCLRKQLP